MWSEIKETLTDPRFVLFELGFWFLWFLYYGLTEWTEL